MIETTQPPNTTELTGTPEQLGKAIYWLLHDKGKEKERHETREGEITKEFLLKVVMPLSLACLMVVCGIWILKIILGI